MLANNVISAYYVLCNTYSNSLLSIKRNSSWPQSVDCLKRTTFRCHGTGVRDCDVVKLCCNSTETSTAAMPPASIQHHPQHAAAAMTQRKLAGWRVGLSWHLSTLWHAIPWNGFRSFRIRYECEIMLSILHHTVLKTFLGNFWFQHKQSIESVWFFVITDSKVRFVCLLCVWF